MRMGFLREESMQEVWSLGPDAAELHRRRPRCSRSCKAALMRGGRVYISARMHRTARFTPTSWQSAFARAETCGPSTPAVCRVGKRMLQGGTSNSWRHLSSSDRPRRSVQHRGACIAQRALRATITQAFASRDEGHVHIQSRGLTLGTYGRCGTTRSCRSAWPAYWIPNISVRMLRGDTALRHSQ